MDWITDKIAIGNFLDAQNLPAGIEAVLCLKGGCSCRDRFDVDAIQIPLIDGAGNKVDDIVQATAFIRQVVQAGKHILVHCHAGRSRSVIVVARYLMAARGISGTEALDLISARREICLTEELKALLAIRS